MFSGIYQFSEYKKVNIFSCYIKCSQWFGVDVHSFIHSTVICWVFTMHKALCEKQSSPGSFKKTAVILSSCFAFLGSGLSCIGPQESLSYLIVFCQNWERLITACCFSARWRLSWPSWRITLLFGTSFTCVLTVSA